MIEMAFCCLKGGRVHKKVDLDLMEDFLRQAYKATDGDFDKAISGFRRSLERLRWSN